MMLSNSVGWSVQLLLLHVLHHLCEMRALGHCNCSLDMHWPLQYLALAFVHAWVPSGDAFIRILWWQSVPE